MDDFTTNGSPDGLVAAPPRAEPPPSVMWRIVAVPILVFSLVSAFSLLSYQAADVSAIQSPPSRVAANWMGGFGANLAWGTLLFFGLVGFLVPVATGAVAVLMLCGRHMRWRPLWMLGLALSLCALAQFFNGAFAPLLASERLDIAPNAGGGVGWLFNHPGSPVLEGLGTAGAATLYGSLALLFLLLLVGFGNVAGAIRAGRARRARLVEEAEDRAIGSRTDLEADDIARAEARRRAREARQSERDAREAERDAARRAAEDERERRRAEKEEEKARRRAEKEAAKERRRAE
ncbi:MAG: DNA translocase FtsK 4TM domain-containing protein, partial [Kiritimatiellae bacterium]|nr:DNA translocase FtsK 4TM domain-containing protein [Kiritimatiellia bacterium]